MPVERRGCTLNYGMKKKALAKRINCSVEEAESIMNRYMDRYPGVVGFFDQAVEMAYQTGCAFTLLGRRRTLSDITSNSNMFRWRAERQASNVPIQGCLPAHVRILTNDGYIPIGSAPDCGTVWTGTSWATYHKLDRGEWELATVTLCNEQVLHCDTRHKYLVLENGSYQFKSWGDLSPGDSICMSATFPGLRRLGPEIRECGQPVRYALQHVAGKDALGRKEKTYTLSVDSPLHRFDSEGVISKNTAADLVRRAMIRIDEEQLDKTHGFLMFHQVHDELVFRGPEKEASEAMMIVQECMEDALGMDLGVRFSTSGESGKSWGEAK